MTLELISDSEATKAAAREAKLPARKERKKHLARREAKRREFLLLPEDRAVRKIARTFDLLHKLADGNLPPPQQGNLTTLIAEWGAIRDVYQAMMTIQDEIDAAPDSTTLEAIDIPNHAAWPV